MTKVITYGTYDLLHYGHIRLLERAKKLGDYLIVGVTADDYDKSRGKINVKQSLMERIEAVRATELADEIIIEEYEGQKIDDIKRYNIDIFTVGSDWIGKFDYLNEYCKVVYLERTEGISSSNIRTQNRKLKLGLVGEEASLTKFAKESNYVNGIQITSIFSENTKYISDLYKNNYKFVNSYEELIEQSDAIYIISHPSKHYEQVKTAILNGKHVLCEAPIAIKKEQCQELFVLAQKNNCILMEAIKTAYSTAYYRLLLLIKSGQIGKVVSVDATCTSLRNIDIKNFEDTKIAWNSICAWGPTALLPIFQILGIDYIKKFITSRFLTGCSNFDTFTKIDFIYKDSVASIKVGNGVKSEGELIISGTNGYIYVPAPWWKTAYFEIRYENAENNRRYFYQLDGEGIRYEIVAFVKSIETKKENSYIDKNISLKISEVIENFYSETDMLKI